MPQSKKVHKEYMRKLRGSQKGSQDEGFTAEGSHPVMKWLIPGERRKKMELIVESLKRHNQLPNVYLGAGKSSLPLDIVSEMLEVTR